MDFDLVIKNARIVTPPGVHHGGVGVRDGKIAAVADRDSLPSASSIIDAEDKYLIPGVVDPHVHVGIATPSLATAFKDDFRTESRAAAAGGVTTVGMHLILKEEGFLHVFEGYKADYEKNAAVDGFFHVQLKDETGFREIPLYPEIGIPSFKLTWGEIGPGGDTWLYRTMSEISKLGDRVRAIVHAENKEIAGFLANKLAKEGRKDFPAWNDSRPWFCEAEYMEKSILFAEVTKCPIFFEHLTIGRGVEILKRAKDRGVNVLAETCPQYLTLTSKEKGVLADHPPFGHVNPPLRDKESNELLWEGISKGIIDSIGSDHAPYKREQKGTNVWDAPPGLGNVTEMILPVLLSEGVNKGRISIEKLVELCCYRTAKIFGLYPRKGGIVVGADADLVLLDMNEKRKVSAKNLHSLCDWSLYEGWEFKGWPVSTFLRGQLVAKDGEVLAKPGTGQWVPR